MGIGPIGVPELLIIFAILVLLFGASRIAGTGKAAGEAAWGRVIAKQRIIVNKLPEGLARDQAERDLELYQAQAITASGTCVDANQ